MDLEPSAEDLYVCSGSGELFGLTGPKVGPPTHEQRCRWTADVYRGEPWHEPRTDLPEPAGDFPTAVEFCCCCATELISSGSRFSSFFCAECRAAARQLADSAGFAVIPLGRHTLMNGVCLDGGDAADPQRLTTFTAAAEGFFARVDRLATWQRGIVADHIDAMAPGATHVPATAYLAFVARHGLPKPVLFQQLYRYFGVEQTFPGVSSRTGGVR
jgi:hypothetical protein